MQVLTGDSSNFSWEPSTDGKAVAYALSTDKIGNEEIFIGRPPFSNNSTTIGRILSSHRCLYIPFKGKEHRIEHYEILVYRKNPIIRNSIGFIQPLYPTRLFDGEIIRGSSAQTLLSYASSSLLQTASNRKNSHNIIEENILILYICQVKWTHTTSRSSIPPTAIFGGRDSNFSIQHIGRCMHEGNLLPCRVVPSKLVALVTSNGIEIEKQTFQILIGSHSKWISSSGGNVPANAFPGGCTKEEEVLYIGRTYYKGGLIVGKVHKSHRCIYVGYNGRELSFPDYEVLIED